MIYKINYKDVENVRLSEKFGHTDRTSVGCFLHRKKPRFIYKIKITHEKNPFFTQKIGPVTIKDMQTPPTPSPEVVKKYLHMFQKILR